MTIKNSELVTKKYLMDVMSDFANTILEGVQRMFDEQNKKNETNFATKDDIKVIREEMATKEDLKREIGWVRDDINGLKADLSDTPSRKEFTELKRKVDHISAS